ncbi:MAG TPA: VCBS repeat-containing protein, partial [Nocardioidaceae bacterium]|nr:VCBS repeat-containing protein [Nocardioidaceae bacterium]
LDADGHDDVALVAPWMGSAIVVMYGNGDGTFDAPGQSITVGSVNNNVILGDFDDSGTTDVAVTGGFGFSVLLNDGGRQYHVAATYSLWQTPFQQSGVTNDFDGDGDLDLALKTVSGIRVMIGNGTGGFTSGPLTNVPFTFPPAIASIDDANLNGDGIPDLVAADAATQQVVALRGTGNGGFIVLSRSFVPFAPTTVRAGDLDHSGRDSVVVMPEASPPGATVAVLRNNGQGSLGSPTYYSGGIANPVGELGDLNGDGNLDIISTNTFSGDMVVLAGVGNGTFVTGGTFATYTNAQTPAVGDFDEDGHTDLVVPSNCPSGGFGGPVCLAVLLNNA